MVGHTGNMRARIRAIEFLDSCLAKIVPATIRQGGVVLIVSDHGNAEKMADWRGHTWTAHTTNPVPFILVSEKPLKLQRVKDAGLANIAPTILKLLGITPPPGMSEPLV
jgi:2,3-bisphosphoglycerate-independent phosphoglycerate mutase